MPSNNVAANVSTGKPNITGGIYRAPLGTTLPSDASTALGGSFTALGYIAQGGVTHGFNIDSGEYRAWGGDLVLSYLNSKTHTFAFGMIEVLNKTTYETIYGEGNVSGTLNSGIKATSPGGGDMTEYVYVVELAMRDGAMKRIVIPDGKITAIGDVVYSDDTAVSYPVTITAQVDTSGNSHYEYIYKAAGT
jgi:hypothetical protein